MAGEAAPEQNGWLKAYLEDILGQVRCLDRKVDGLADRMTRLEAAQDAIAGSRAERRRWHQGLREWITPVLGAATGAAAGFFSSHH